MFKNGWVLFAAWVVFVTLLGPFLFSARDTLLVLLGFGTFIGLVLWTSVFMGRGGLR